ncbi:MAG: hypothetical protein Q4P33_05205 [Flaviflexus sp.]|nr:hypothetical protein [Flaviflexus sp.]
MAGRYGRRSPGRHGLDESSSGIAWDSWLAYNSGPDATPATLPAFPDDPAAESLAPNPGDRPDLAEQVPQGHTAVETLPPDLPAPEAAREVAPDDSTPLGAAPEDCEARPDRGAVRTGAADEENAEDLAAVSIRGDGEDRQRGKEAAREAESFSPEPAAAPTHASRLAHAELGPIPGLEDADPTMIDEPGEDEDQLEGPRDYLPQARAFQPAPVQPSPDPAVDPAIDPTPDPDPEAVVDPAGDNDSAPALAPGATPDEPSTASSAEQAARQAAEVSHEDSLFARVNAQEEPPASQSPNTDEFEIDPSLMSSSKRGGTTELKDYLEIGAYQGMLLTVLLGILFFFSGQQVPYTLGHLLIAPLIVAGTVALAAAYLHGISRKSRRFATVSAIIAGLIIIPTITAVVLLGQKIILFVGSPWWWLAIALPFLILALAARRIPGGKPKEPVAPDDDEEWKIRTGEILRTVKQMSDKRVDHILADCEEGASGPLAETFGSPEAFTRRFEVDRQAGRRRTATFSAIAALAFLSYAVFQFFSEPSGSSTVAIALILAALSAHSWWRNRAGASRTAGTDHPEA